MAHTVNEPNSDLCDVRMKQIAEFMVGEGCRMYKGGGGTLSWKGKIAQNREFEAPKENRRNIVTEYKSISR